LAVYRSAMPIPGFVRRVLIAPRIFTATSGPMRRAMAEMPIGDVTSIFSAGVLSRKNGQTRTVEPTR
jgi:hypothetical protein